MFAARAAPVLSYVAQAIPASLEVNGSFCVAVTRLWHAPVKSLPEPALRPIRLVGAPVPRHVGDSLRAAFQASQTRMASVAEEAMAILSRARELYDPLPRSLMARAMLRLFWGTKAFCVELTAPRGDDASAAAAQQAKEMKSVRKKALDASRRADRAPVASCHKAAAEALDPRLMRWREALGVLADVVVLVASRAIAAPTACAQTWCDAWPTSARRGQRPAPCPSCGRPGRDTVAHLIRCPELTRAVAQVMRIPSPSSLREALCHSRSRGRRACARDSRGPSFGRSSCPSNGHCCTGSGRLAPAAGDDRGQACQEAIGRRVRRVRIVCMLQMSFL